ncbi:MAG: AMP-binding protein [Planctomycetota bacterium]|nr:AMP-binding protein [Planctomycetota bacterium]MDA1179837.1 AMP-binding protein [Planctomycetota bacterium]
MNSTSYECRRRWEAMSADDLAHHQLSRLDGLLQSILPQNTFYATKLAEQRLPLRSLEQFAEFPYTTKSELILSGSPVDFAANRTFDLGNYSRFHRTSGTHGRPMAVVDTNEDWQWWIATWQFVLDAAELSTDDCVFMAFSFGPFIGFWSAFDAITERGAMAVPGGGMNSRARIDLLAASHCNVMCCTPTYALHLAEVAIEHQTDPSTLGIRRIVVAGEPGGSVPAVRERIQQAWNARVIDHGGATEVGPWGYGTSDGTGLHVVETEFLAEFRSVESGRPSHEGELSELVLTTLGRSGCPVIRYRTGDLVRPSWNHAGPNRFVRLDGGVLGRIDDMLVIRGVNVFPSAIAQILHSFPEVVEHRLLAHKKGEMDALAIEVEDRLEQPHRIADELMRRLGLKVQVRCVPLGSLPRFEGKGKRFVDLRNTTG